MQGFSVILAALFGCFVYFLGAMSRVAVPGMAFELIMADYGFTADQIAMLPSAGVIGCMASIGVAGLLVDRYGWARMLLVGSLVQALGYIPVHESSRLPWMLAGEFVNGGGRTIVYLAILKLFDVSFSRKNFAALIGIFYIFAYGGTLSASEAFPWLMDLCGTWQLAARAVNFGTLAGALLIAIALSVGLRSRTNAVAETSDGGCKLFAWASLKGAFASPIACTALIAAGLNIAIYWSFLTVSAGPYLRSIDQAGLLRAMNGIVMFGMVAMGSVSLFFGNARRPFFLWGSSALVAGFAALLAGFPILGCVLIGAGYGVTSVLLAGTKECVPVAFMASAIGFTNFFANIVQVGANQASGILMETDKMGYGAIFALYLALSTVSLVAAVWHCLIRRRPAVS